MEMTVEEYRNRMIQAFHNAECGNLIALVVLPSEKEFEHLEWLLKNLYKTPKDQYEARLKADMAAMLTDLSMEIGEIEDGYTEFDEENKRSLTMIPLENVDRLIQQKIDKLKGVEK